jgi:GNAT superfamily N-acetyltransferase
MGGVRSGELRRIYVRPEHRGRGVARRLIAILAAEVPSAQAIVAKQNAPARRAFLASGFTASGKTPDHPKMQHCEILEKKTC